MYIARKPFRYENRVFMQGEHVTVKDDDVRMLQGQGKIGGRVKEAATVKPPENAMMPKAEPKAEPKAKTKKLGGGWFEVRGQKVQGKEAAEKLLEEGD
jgi:hypothetical protein